VEAQARADLVRRDTPEDPRQALGRRGELAAERVLAAAGVQVVARRHRRRSGELDLVGVDGDVVVFVEVKTRRGTSCGTGAEAITPQKRRRIARNALGFLAERGWCERRCRFDVVEVQVGEELQERVAHLRDAFRVWPTG
jgi:putative endonuclease